MWRRFFFVACLGALGCSAHDVVKPNVDEGRGGEDAGREGGAGSDDADVNPGQPSADCNWTGIWFTKTVTVTQALGLPQTAAAWYYVEIDQPAGSAEFTITRSMDCGTEVHGSVLVTVPIPTLDAVMKRNSQAGRKGTIKKSPGGQCVVTSEQFWIILGAEDRFVPARNTASEIEPIAMQLPLPSIERPDGAQDWEADGKLGVLWQVSGVLQGTRSTVQRQWNRWFTTERYSVTPAMDWGDVVVAADFDKDENIFDPTSGPLLSPSYSVRTPETPNRYFMRFLGRTKSDPRAAAEVRGTDPVADTAAARETCIHLQDNLGADDM
jgi:hypothetical protein